MLKHNYPTGSRLDPKKVQNELKALINTGDEEMVSVSVKALKSGLKDVKLIRKGKIKTRPVSELFKELKNGI